MLERMYLRWASAQGFSTHVTDRSAGKLSVPPVVHSSAMLQLTGLVMAEMASNGLRTASKMRGRSCGGQHDAKHPVAQMSRHCMRTKHSMAGSRALDQNKSMSPCALQARRRG